MLLWLKNLGQAGSGYDVGHFWDEVISPFYLDLWESLRKRELSASKQHKKLVVKRKVLETRIEKAAIEPDLAARKRIRPRVDAYELKRIENALESLELEIEAYAMKMVQEQIDEDEAVLVLLMAI